MSDEYYSPPGMPKAQAPGPSAYDKLPRTVENYRRRCPRCMGAGGQPSRVVGRLSECPRCKGTGLKDLDIKDLAKAEPDPSWFTKP